TVEVSTAAQLLVKKHVINDSGGSDATLAANNFGLTLVAANGTFVQNFAGDENGVLFELPRGADYALTESFNPGPYAVSYSADCSGTLLSLHYALPILTVEVSTAAQLLVKKHVINDSGGSDATLAANNF